MRNPLYNGKLHSIALVLCHSLILGWPFGNKRVFDIKNKLATPIFGCDKALAILKTPRWAVLSQGAFGSKKGRQTADETLDKQPRVVEVIA